MPRLLSATGASVFEYAKRSWLELLTAITLALALAKGFALEAHPYALSQYMYTYGRGFLIRALPGQVAKWSCGDDFRCVWWFVEVVGALSVVAFTVVLFLLVRSRSKSPAATLMLAVVGSGPLLVQIGAGRGYHDALALTLGLVAYYSFLSRRLVLAALVFLVALLVHELVAMYVLPLFLLSVVEPKRSDTAKRFATIVFLALATLAVVETGRASREQKGYLNARLDDSAAALSSEWRGYRRMGPLAAKKRVGKPTTKHLGKLKQPRYRPYLLPVAATLLVSAVVLGARRRFFAIALYWLVMLLPFGIMLVAWDVDRLTSLVGVTALLAWVELVRRYEIRRVPAWVWAVAAVVVVGQLARPYDVTIRYARGRTLLGAVLETNEKRDFFLTRKRKGRTR